VIVTVLTSNRLHVEGDLEPYVCISEDCINPLRYFKTFDQWESHMQDRHTPRWAERIHTQRWYCDFEHDSIQEFDKEHSLKDHLSAEHGQELTTSQLRGRLRRNRRIAARNAFICPICDSEPANVRKRGNGNPYQPLWNHIGQHLKLLAFSSLPYDQFAAGEPQSTLYAATTDQDEITKTSKNDEKQGSEDLTTVPETLVLEYGSCEVDDLAVSACSCCVDRPHNQKTTFRAETELPEAIIWTEIDLKMQQMSSLHTNYEELAKGLGVIDVNVKDEAGWSSDESCGSEDELSLRGKLIKMFYTSDFHKPRRKFLPEDQVKTLITEGTVLEELERAEHMNTTDLLGSTSLEKNAVWIAKEAPRTFATIVISKLDPGRLSRYMTVLRNIKFTDESLSMENIETVLGNTLLKGQEIQDELKAKRWRFLVPVFGPHMYKYILPAESILPFSAEPGVIQSDASTTMKKVYIHPAHQDWWNRQVGTGTLKFIELS
jgi:cytochrome c1